MWYVLGGYGQCLVWICLNYRRSTILVLLSILSEPARGICNDGFAQVFPNNVSIKIIYIWCVNCNELFIKHLFLRRARNIGVNQHFPETWLINTPPPPPWKQSYKINIKNPEAKTCRSCDTLNTLKNNNIFPTYVMTFSTYTILK